MIDIHLIIFKNFGVRHQLIGALHPHKNEFLKSIRALFRCREDYYSVEIELTQKNWASHHDVDSIYSQSLLYSFQLFLCQLLRVNILKKIHGVELEFEAWSAQLLLQFCRSYLRAEKFLNMYRVMLELFVCAEELAAESGLFK